MNKTLPFGVTVLASACLASTAQAGGFSTARFGGEHGHPTADNPTAIYYNPAGIAASDGINIMADGSIAFRWASYEHNQNTALASDLPEPSDAVGANYGKATLFNVRAAPMIGGTVSAPIAEGYGIAGGLALFVPFGGSASWDKNEAFEGSPYVGAIDGPQRWYTINGTLQSIYVSAALAVKLADIVHLGVSGGIALTSVDTIRARAAAGAENPIDRLEGRAWLDTSGMHGHIGGGILVTPLEDEDKLRFGFSYQAPPGFTNTNVRGHLQKYLAGKLSGEVEEVEVHQQFPDTFRWGGSYRPMPELELRLFGDVTRWSLFSEQCIATVGQDCAITGDLAEATDNETPEQYGEGTPAVQVNLPRNWKDTFSLRFGLSYWVIEPVELFGGLGYDSNAIPDTNLDPALTDFHDISVALGARVRLIEELSAALSYTHFFYVPRNTQGESYNARYRGASAGPASGGSYKQTIGVVNVNLIGSFDPFTPAAAEAEARR